jgi:hypothetical protein
VGIPPVRNNRGTIVLVLGILSFVGFGCLTGIPAWIMGNQVLADMDRGIIDTTDRGLAQCGKILGMLATCLMACGVILYVGFIALFIGGTAYLMRQEPRFDSRVFARAESQRQAILAAAKSERTRNPHKTYSILAKELASASGGKVAWYPKDLTPPVGCGSLYTFTAENGTLTLKDGCGVDGLYGWPAKASP